MSSNSSSPARKGIMPALTLALLAPVVAEVLSGATRLSFIFALIPEIMLWGCGALIIREIVRRRGLSWPSLLLMGLALSVAEEFLIQQTSLAPLPWLGSRPIYGRAWGVNWLYFVFMLGYESVWVVLVPIQLTELLFREWRGEPWLRTRGLVVSGVIFILGAFVAWYAWIKRARPMVFHVPAYHPHVLTLLLGALAIILLVTAALVLRTSRLLLSTSAPSPSLVGILTVALGLPWYAVISLVFISNARVHAIPFWIFVIAALAWAGMVFHLIRRWSCSEHWSDMHRYALVFGAVGVCIIGGFAGSSSWPRSDLIGKITMDVLAVVLLIILGRVLQMHPSNASHQ